MISMPLMESLLRIAVLKYIKNDVTLLLHLYQ